MSVLSNISRKIFCLIAIFDFNQSLHAASAPTINEFETGREFFEILGEVPSISPYCLRTDNKEFNRDWHELIKLIQLDLNQENYLKSMVVKANDHFNTKRNVWADYKKVTLSIKNTNCKFKGRYRLTGDGVDHFGAAGQLRHSVKIKLRSDNIGWIVKFKLLVPETRGAEVEVLNTLLHRELGFLAPRTALVNVDFQGESVLALFQEDITKELVEENSVHDGLLFEGDESLGIAALFTVPRITNEKLLSGSVNKKIARSVYKDLNSVYLSTGILSKAMFPELLNYLYDPPLAIDTDKQLFANNISEFHLLNYALYSEHGLSQDDSRFVYDPISRVLRPIYYDGYSGLRDGSSLKKANFSFKEAERLKLIKQISKLDRKLFHSKAMKLGINQNFKEISKFLETTIINLKLIETSENYKTAIEAKTALSQEQIMSAFSSSLEPRLPQKLKKN